MLIRRRVEKLKRSTLPTLERLLEQVERDTTRSLSLEEQKCLHESDRSSPVMERYQNALSAALTNVDDDALDRMIRMCEARSQ